MNVSVLELGSRPSLLTKARLNAPQGAKAIGALLGQQEWADLAMVALDWQPDELAGGERANDAVLRMLVYKEVKPRNRVLTISWNLDVNDIFTKDQITRDDLMWVVDELKQKLNYELHRAGVN